MHKIDIDLFETIESSKWSDKRKRSIDCNNPKGFSEKQYCKRQKRGGAYKSEALTKKQKEKLVELEKEVPMTDFIKKYGEKEGRAIYFATLTKMAKAADNRIPEKRKDGSKRPKSKHSDLYTDENPEGTIKGLGFKDPESARKSVNIIEKSKKTHKHKVQATMAMEQRSRFAAKNAKDSKTKKRLLAANKIYKAYLEKLKKRTKVSVSSIMDNKVNIDFSEEIKSHDLFCDCENSDEEYISEQSWASEKNKGKKLNKPFRTPGGPKKFSVYVKNEKGNVVKVNFGDPNMEIKRDDPNRRKNFRARHNCDNPGPKTKARYWSCRQWWSCAFA